jgi:hypothetical protein
VSFSLDPVTSQKIDHMVDGLVSEFGGEFSRPQIEELMQDSARRLAATATAGTDGLFTPRAPDRDQPLTCQTRRQQRQEVDDRSGGTICARTAVPAECTETRFPDNFAVSAAAI